MADPTGGLILYSWNETRGLNLASGEPLILNNNEQAVYFWMFRSPAMSNLWNIRCRFRYRTADQSDLPAWPSAWNTWQEEIPAGNVPNFGETTRGSVMSGEYLTFDSSVLATTGNVAGEVMFQFENALSSAGWVDGGTYSIMLVPTGELTAAVEDGDIIIRGLGDIEEIFLGDISYRDENNTLIYCARRVTNRAYNYPATGGEARIPSSDVLALPPSGATLTGHFSSRVYGVTSGVHDRDSDKTIHCQYGSIDDVGTFAAAVSGRAVAFELTPPSGVEFASVNVAMQGGGMAVDNVPLTLSDGVYRGVHLYPPLDTPLTYTATATNALAQVGMDTATVTVPSNRHLVFSWAGGSVEMDKSISWDFTDSVASEVYDSISGYPVVYQGNSRSATGSASGRIWTKCLPNAADDSQTWRDMPAVCFFRAPNGERRKVNIRRVRRGDAAGNARSTITVDMEEVE